MAKKKSPAGSDRKEPSFEQSLEKLEDIVHQLEEGQLGLNDALARYEEGVKSLKRCYQSLEKAERRIELLAGVDAEGRPVTQPFEEGAMSLEEKKESRSRRRSQPRSGGKSPQGDDDMDKTGGLF